MITRAPVRQGARLVEPLLRATLLLIWLYVILIGGTWAVISSASIRLVTQGVMIGVIGVWLIATAWQGKALPRTRLDRPVVAFLAATVLATALSINARLSLEAALLVGGYALLLYLLVSLSSDRRDVVLSVIIGGSAVAAVAAISAVAVRYWGLAPVLGAGIAWPNVAPPGQWLPSIPLRPGWVTGNPNVLAGLLAPLAPVGLALALSSKGWPKAVAASAWTLVLLGGIAAAFSRGGFAATFAAIAAYFGLRYVLRQRDAVARFVSVPWRPMAVGLGVALVAVAGSWRLLSTAGVFTNGSAGVRLALWGDALRMIERRPLLGLGPDSFGLGLLQLRAPTAPAADLLPHPHNLYLGLAAEMGVVGLGVALWLGIAVARSWWRVASVRRQDAALVTGLMAALVGMAVHGVVEDFRVTPLIVVEGLAFVALIVAAEQGIERTSKKQGVSARLALIPAALLLAGASFTSFTRWEFDTGVRLADAGKQREALVHLDKAARDDPAMPFYAIEAAFVRGRLAEEDDDPAQRDAAIEAYAAALRSEDGYALNHANLGALLWKTGRKAEAARELERAVALRPAGTSFQIDLGTLLQEQGLQDAADDRFAAALMIDPGLLTAPHWRKPVGARWQAVYERAWEQLAGSSPFQRAKRRGALAGAAGQAREAVEQFQLAVAADPAAADAWHDLALALDQDGRQREGIDALRRAVAMAPAETKMHSALAKVLLSAGELPEARREATLALFIQSNTEAETVLARLDRADGKWAEALDHYRAALPARASYLLYGLSVWRRAGLREDTLSPLSPIGLAASDEAIRTEYASLLIKLGRQGEAAALVGGEGSE